MTWSKTRSVGIYVYDKVETLDFTGPYEVFTVPTRVAARDAPGAIKPFHVSLVGETADPIMGRHGLRVIPDYTIENAPEFDVLVIPGGWHRDQIPRTRVIDWIRRQAQTAEFVTSVCTGAFLLAEAGILDGKRATTHWEDIADFARDYPAVTVVDGTPFVHDGNVITSGGISAGLDMSFHLLTEICGPALAETTARQIDYLWARRIDTSSVNPR